MCYFKSFRAETGVRFQLSTGRPGRPVGSYHTDLLTDDFCFGE